MIPPCPECCDTPGGCTIDSDTFDSDLSKWDEVSGTWSVAGGVLDGDGAGTLLLLAAPTLATDGVHIATNVDREGGGPATVRLIAGYDDANNYVFGELDHDSAGTLGTIRVGVRVSGVETWLSSAVELRDDTELSDAHDVEFCWKPPVTQEPTDGIVRSLPGFVNDISATWEDEELVAEMGGGNAVQQFGSDDVSGFLNVSDFGFVIPPDATINGLEVGINARADLDTPNCGFFNTVALSLTGSSNLAASTQINDGALQLEGFGGPTAMWGVSITPSDLMDVAFGVAVKVEASGTSAGGSIGLDYIDVTVYYTSSDKTRGVVTLRYTNTEVGAVPLTQCAIGTTTYEAPGKSVGIRITSGNWDFASFTASYLDSPTHQPCPTCGCSNVTCPCCSTDDPADQAYIVDLGSGWTDDDCDCSAVQGEYVLEWGFIGGDGVCYWFYQEEITCGESTGNLYIQLQLADTGAECEWFLLVTVVAADGEYSTVVYRGNVVDGACTDDAPFTLPIWVATGSANPPCAGSPPSTAELDVVA